MKTISRLFLQGLATILPVGLTIYAVWFVLAGIEKLAHEGIITLTGKDYYLPGTGLVLTLAIIVGVGVLMNFWLVRRIVELGEKIFASIPGVKTIFNGIRDLMGFINTSPQEEADTVVVVQVAEDRNLLGFITRRNCDDMPDELAGEDFIAVYIPMSYQLGGYTIFMPRKDVIPLEMDMETGMRLALTGGVGGNKEKKRGSPAADKTTPEE